LKAEKWKGKQQILPTGHTKCVGDFREINSFGWYNDTVKNSSITTRDVNIEFFPNPDIECDNPVKIRISDFIRAA